MGKDIGSVIASISSAISSNNIVNPQKWDVVEGAQVRGESCEVLKNNRRILDLYCEPRTYLYVSAIYNSYKKENENKEPKEMKPADLVFSGVRDLQPTNRVFQLASVYYFAKIGENKISLLDGLTIGGDQLTRSPDGSITLGNQLIISPEGKIAQGCQLTRSTNGEIALTISPDGKITGGDQLTIDGFTYSVSEVSRGVLEFKDQSNDTAEYNGLRFRKDEDKWEFIGPPDRETEAQKLKYIVENTELKYRRALNEAQGTLPSN